MGTLLLQPSRGLAKAVGHLSPQLSLLLTRSREAAFLPQSPGTASPRPHGSAEALATTARGPGRTLVF